MPRTWQNLFAITRFRYIEVIFHIFYYYWSKENRSLYRELPSIEVRYVIQRDEGPDPAFPLAFTGISHPELLSSLSRISFSFPIPHPCPNLGESCFPGSSQISYPVNVSRIPHFIVAKSRIPGTRYILFSFDDNLASSPGIMFFKLLCNSMAKFRQ